MELNIADSNSKEQKKLYWLLQLAGWFALMFIEIFNYTFFIKGEFHWNYFYSFGIFPIIGICSTHVYKTYFIPKSTFDKRLGKVWSKGLFDVVMISILIVVLGRLFYLFRNSSFIILPFKELLLLILPQFMNIARYVLVWIVIYYLYHILQHNNKLQKEKLEKENRAKMTELELLKHQLNPHFLFHSLSSIKALVLENKELARDGIIKLSELLRYSLNYEKNSLVNVKTELLELNKYLELEKLRLGNRLTFELKIEDSHLDDKIPNAALLNIVEFAIRTGIERRENEGKLALEVSVMDDMLQFNLIYQKPSNSSTQISEGLENLKKRLERIYGNEAVLSLGNIENEHIVQKMVVPKIKKT